MGRAPCCDRMGLKKGPWTPEEDRILISFINRHGHGNWRALPKQAGLLRCGKSCRLRWTNYLRPDIKRGNFSPDEENTIIELHERLGNKWSVIASQLPGRTDNEIKNVWNTHLKKRVPQKTQQDFPNHINSGISDIMSKFLHASNTSVSDSAKPESTTTTTTTTNENSSTETCSSNSSSSHSQFDPCHITIEENTAYPSMASPSMGSACSSLSNLDDALHIPQDADMMNSWLPEIIEHNTYHEEFSNIHNNGDSENVDLWIQMLSELGPSPVFPISDGHCDDATFWF